MNIKIVFTDGDNAVYEDFESVETYWNDADNKHYYIVCANWQEKEYLVTDVAQIIIS